MKKNDKNYDCIIYTAYLIYLFKQLKYEKLISKSDYEVFKEIILDYLDMKKEVL